MIQVAHSKEVKYMPCIDCSHTRLNDASNLGDTKAIVQDGMGCSTTILSFHPINLLNTLFLLLAHSSCSSHKRLYSTQQGTPVTRGAPKAQAKTIPNKPKERQFRRTGERKGSNNDNHRSQKGCHRLIRGDRLTRVKGDLSSLVGRLPRRPPRINS